MAGLRSRGRSDRSCRCGPASAGQLIGVAGTLDLDEAGFGPWCARNDGRDLGRANGSLRSSRELRVLSAVVPVMVVLDLAAA
jgi:hypothetical protein